MAGERIHKIGHLISMIIESLKVWSKESDEAEIRVAILTYSNDAHWVTRGLEPVEKLRWEQEYLHPCGMRCLGKAIDTLGMSLSRKAFMQSESGFCVPMIIFMSDADSQDDYDAALNHIRSTNRWFKESIKLAMIDEKYESNMEMARKLVDHEKCIIPIQDYNYPQDIVDNIQEFLRVIRIGPGDGCGMPGKAEKDDCDESELFEMTPIDFEDSGEWVKNFC